ncbi:MAG: 50S ribosomal protein L5 [Candidatus Omnitrophica bacterium]|nr:50S ribosomal protein L5 [Candidatus Omnitrophota bacterium]
MSESNLKTYTPRLLQIYREEIVPELKKKQNHRNVHSVPRLVKIVVNMGVGEAISDSKLIDSVLEQLATITGQKPKVCRARKAISNFKLREGVAIGCCTTLRKAMMYDFFDRLISMAIPRIRDFRGLSPNSFDGSGNYNFGLVEQGIFPEINLDKITRTQGMNISIHTTAKSDQEARELLEAFGFPFRRKNG